MKYGEKENVKMIQDSRFKIQEKGFTLIEMLIVVAIVGILASVVLIGLGPTQRSGRDARRLADLKQVQTALELYFQKNGSYPNTTTWTGASGLTGILTGASLGVTNLPNDPKAGTDYKYSPNASLNGYLVGATLDDPGNPALNTDIDGAQSSYGNIDCGTAGAGDTVYCLIF